MSQPRYVKPGVAERALGVDRRTLKRWAAWGGITSIQPGGKGQHLYDLNSVSSSLGGVAVPEPTGTEEGANVDLGGQAAGSTGDGCDEQREDVIYARVSTRKQLDHLDTQVAGLESRYPGCRVFRDCASGLNFRRKGLQALLQLATQGRVRRVHVAYKDRLCRFAYDLIEFVLAQHGAEIVVESDDAQSPEQDLADDVISVITVFGARLYGKRRGGRRRKQAAEEGGGSSSSDGDASTGHGREAQKAAAVPAEGGVGGPSTGLPDSDVPDADASD